MFRRCRGVYQPINGSGGKPAASPSSPSRFTSAAVKPNQAPQAPSATAWRHLRKDSLPTQQAPAIANRLVSLSSIAVMPAIRR